MSLILLRHTRPQGADGLCYGRTDLPLAAGLSNSVARLNDGLPRVERIVTSPLSRCRILADALGRARGLPVEIDPDLIEMDFGAWENVPWDRIPRDEIDAWSKDFMEARPHGGERVRDLAQRVGLAIDRLGGGRRPVLAVTHAGVIKAVLAHLNRDGGWRAETAFGSWRKVELP